MRRAHAKQPPRHARTRAASRIAVIVAGFLAVAGCDEAPAPPPPLPGVQAGDAEWFWRDVLAAPLPDEAAPRDDLLALQPPAARMDALTDLAKAGDPAALATLMAALRDDQTAVACGAAQDLGLHGLAAALPRLLKGIGPYPVDYDVPIEVRAAEASALARLGNPAGVPLILSILGEGSADPDPIEALQWTRTTRNAFTQRLALEGLVALAGTDFGFRAMASVPARTDSVSRARAWWNEHRHRLWARAPVDDPGVIARARLMIAHLDAYQLRQIDGARFALAHLGPNVLPYLEEGLRHGDTYVRMHSLEVMETLCGLVDDKVAGRLAIVASRPLLEDADTAVAAQAARVAGAARVVDPLVVALDRRAEPAVRLALVDALAATRRDTARAPLDTWWQRTGAAAAAASPDLRAAYAAARLALDPQADPEPLLAMLADADASVAYPALERLVELVGADFDLDPAQPPADRAPALAAARAALAARSTTAIRPPGYPPPGN